jgi:HEAT repeat protein
MDHLPKLKRSALLAGSVVLLALLGYASWVHLTEPRYQGKPVSYWFQAFRNFGRTNTYLMENGVRIYRKENSDPAFDALCAMGEPAAAFLAQRLASPHCVIVSRSNRVYTNLPTFVRSLLPDLLARDIEQVEWTSAAIEALASMGTKVPEAIPVLIDLLKNQPGYFDQIHPTLRSLKVPNSEMERLLQALAQQGRQSDVRKVIDQKAIRLPIAAGLIAEMLPMKEAGDFWPFHKLREMGPDAEVAVPTLLRTITSTNSEVRYQSAWTLEAIGPGASNAIPALRACATDSSSMVQSAAKRAIEAITATNPVALPK